MGRIRSIKPEFPQSESMGNVSRDARLLFILIWTICDDSGKARASSRMLASLLFPYDDDAPILIDDWIAELEREGCIARYLIEGAHYLQVAKWLSHQKIDRPSASKIPPFDESSRILANPRESSCKDQGSRIKDQGEDQESLRREKIAPPNSGLENAPAKKAEPRGSRIPEDWEPTEDEIAWARSNRPDVDPEAEAENFRDFWTAKAGSDGRKLDWSATWRTWIRRANGRPIFSGNRPAPISSGRDTGPTHGRREL